jgi:hypothetical protein
MNKSTRVERSTDWTKSEQTSNLGQLALSANTAKDNGTSCSGWVFRQCDTFLTENLKPHNLFRLSPVICFQREKKRKNPTRAHRFINHRLLDVKHVFCVSQ